MRIAAARSIVRKTKREVFKMATLFNLLKQEHRDVQKLLVQIDANLDHGVPDNEIWGDFDEMSDRLFAHARAEEDVIYSQMREREESKDFAYEAIEEHQVVVNILAKLQAAERIDDRWRGRFKVLKELVETHIKEEESSGFARLRKAFDTNELEQMADDMETAEVSVMESDVHPEMYTDWFKRSQLGQRHAQAPRVPSR